MFTQHTPDSTPAGFPGASPAGATGGQIGHVLVVCTGNICRSPFGEYVLADLLDGTGIAVSSAGVYAMEGQGVDAGMQPHLARLGIDARDFVAHQVDAEDVEDADLILTMSRRQRAFILEEWPGAARKTLLLGAVPELPGVLAELRAPSAERRVPAHRRVGHSEAPSADASPRASVADAVQVLARQSTSGIPEVADPYRKSPELYAAAAQSVSDYMTSLAATLRQG